LSVSLLERSAIQGNEVMGRNAKSGASSWIESLNWRKPCTFWDTLWNRAPRRSGYSEGAIRYSDIIHVPIASQMMIGSCLISEYLIVPDDRFPRFQGPKISNLLALYLVLTRLHYGQPFTI
jgi:hypothetical protein